MILLMNNRTTNNNENQDEITYAQKCILEKVTQKKDTMSFQDWTEYEESYGTDYNDCHGDYYDSE